MKTVLICIVLFVLFCFPRINGQTPATAQHIQQETPSKKHYQWVQVTQRAAFPGSYNFTLFTVDDQLWAFHPEGIWNSSDGKTWKKSPLPRILNDAFLDYVQFKGAIYALGTFTGNIEHFTQTSKISRTTDLKHWEVIAEQSNIPQRYFYTSVVFKGKIWIIGGECKDTTFGDVWNSEDAVHWKQVSRDNPWKATGGRGAVVFNDRIYLFIGKGSEPVRVYSSSDGIQWILETNQVHPLTFWGEKAIVFDKKIWLLGCNRSGTFANEVLCSSDGKNWISGHAPWSPRGGVAATVFHDKLYITGGKYSTGTGDNIRFIYSNDVWYMEKLK